MESTPLAGKSCMSICKTACVVLALTMTALFVLDTAGHRSITVVAPPYIYQSKPAVRISGAAPKAPPNTSRALSSADIDALSDTCGRDTAEDFLPPWDKCRRDFLPPNITLVSPPAGEPVRVGDTVHYRIDSNLVPSSGCDPGGDFWHAVLASDAEKPRASCAATIVDNCDGSYDMYALAAWPGNSTFRLTLVYPGDAVRHLRRVVWHTQDRVSFIGYFQHGKKQKSYKNLPHSPCYFRRNSDWAGVCPYPHQRAMGKTTLVCDKIDGVPCDSLHIMKGHGARIEGSAKMLSANVSYLFTKPNRTEPLWTPSASLETEGKDYDPGEQPRCRPDQPVPRFQGYWRQGKWHSLLCAMKTDWTQRDRLRECLKNKRWVLHGDSTTRQWYLLLLKLIGIKVPAPPGDSYCCHMLREYKTLNATLRFQMHPHVLASYAVKLEEVMFEVDVLDGLVDPACNYVVVVSPWAHFTQWTKESYVERTGLLREAVLRLRRRCPDAPVVLKGPHPRTAKAFSDHIYGSDYIIKQIEAINREMLKGIGVWFLPLWDINLAHPRANTVHMPNNIIREELKMFLTYVCES